MSVCNAATFPVLAFLADARSETIARARNTFARRRRTLTGGTLRGFFREILKKLSRADWPITRLPSHQDESFSGRAGAGHKLYAPGSQRDEENGAARIP